MITFYFNSNLPEYYTGDLCEVFDNLMLKFILLLNDKKLPINGYIATNNQPSMGGRFRCTKEYSRSSTVRCGNATS